MYLAYVCTQTKTQSEREERASGVLNIRDILKGENKACGCHWLDLILFERGDDERNRAGILCIVYSTIMMHHNDQVSTTLINMYRLGTIITLPNLSLLCIYVWANTKLQVDYRQPRSSSKMSSLIKSSWFICMSYMNTTITEWQLLLQKIRFLPVCLRLSDSSPPLWL